MKWDKYILLNLDPWDECLQNCSPAWEYRYRIRLNRRFTITPARDYTTLNPQSLTISNENTKIIVMSHGSASTVYAHEGKTFSPSEFATFLHFHGLRRAGLLAMKGCKIGKKDYLDELARALVRKNILVDWLIGYQHPAAMLDNCDNEGIGRVDQLLRHLTKGEFKLPDRFRVKVVKGHPGAFPRPHSCRYI